MSKPLRHGLASIVILSLGAGVAGGAESASNPAKGSPSAASKAPAVSTTARPAPGRGSSAAKGPLPDPVLLDGSTLPVEKRPEHGMIGDFELPGDENARNGKVGGPQNQGPGGQSGLQTNMPMGLPQGGASQSGQQSGQQGGQQGSQGSQSQAGGQQAQQGAQGSQGSAGAQASTGAEGGAQAGGVQVGELTGEGADPGAAGKASKPQQVAIGDSAMRIESTAPSPGVVGSQIPAGPTQQHDKGTGSGGKGAAGSGGNKGVERGRTMPSGL